MSPLLRYLFWTLGVLLAVAVVTKRGRRLLVHCVGVLLNGKNPLRWFVGLLAGVLPPVCWTLAFKLARNIPPEWRPEIHTHFLLIMEAFILSPAGILLVTLLLSPVAGLVRLRSRTPTGRILYPATILLFPVWLKVLNTIALGVAWSDSQDVLAWIFYGVLHFASPFLAGWWIWGFGPPGAAIVFGCTLGAQNLTGLISHILFPTAAPWFYDEHPDWETLLVDYSFPGSSAGLVRVDKVLGTHLYQQAFKKSPVVFGALPSLHAATAVCFSLFVARYGGKWGHVVMFAYASVMFWSTQYLHHHWASDLLMGTLLSAGAFTVATTVLRRLEDKHEREATTRGVDRLFCWPSPHAQRTETLPLYRTDGVDEGSALTQDEGSVDTEKAHPTRAAGEDRWGLGKALSVILPHRGRQGSVGEEKQAMLSDCEDGDCARSGSRSPSSPLSETTCVGSATCPTDSAKRLD
ncbi:unnamed protein product [Parajaminaea phylloscopi]